MTTLAAVICVRMSSSRLPNKPLVVYDTYTNKPNLQCLIERVQTSRYHPEIIVATSTDPSDDPIETLCKDKGYRFIRGPLENVVKRFDQALAFIPKTDYIWRVMADCPLVDIGLMDWRVDVLSRNQADVMTILQPEPTYAAQASVWSREAWEQCTKLSSGSMLSHPGEFIYENLHEFRHLVEPGPENVYYQSIRTELDTPEDLEFFKACWKNLGIAVQDTITDKIEIKNMNDTKRVLTWLSLRPDIVALNAHIEMKTKSSHLHGHHRARSVKCDNPECNQIVAYKVNDRIDITCPACGTTKKFYI